MSQLWANIAATARIGGAYLEHSNFIKKTLLEPAEQRSALVAQYGRSLSPASLIGFKLCLQMLAMKEKNGATKAAMISLMDGAQLTFTEVIGASVSAIGQASVNEADPAFIRHCELLDALLAMGSDADRAQEIKRYVETLDNNGLATFAAHLDHIERSIRDQIDKQVGGESSAWGSSFEDKAAYGMAYLRAPAPNPTTNRRLAELQRGLAVVEQMKRARSFAALKGQMAKLGAQTSAAKDVFGRVATAISARAMQPDEAKLGLLLPAPDDASAAEPDANAASVLDVPDPRVAQIVDIFSRQDRAAKVRFVVACPDVQVKPAVIASIGSGDPKLDYMLLLLLAEPYCGSADAAQGIAIAKAVYSMAQAAAGDDGSGEMIEIVAKAAITVLLGYSALKAAIDPVLFGREASVWLDRHGHVTNKLRLLLSRVEAHMRLDQFTEAGELLGLAEITDIPIDQPAEGQRLTRLRETFARRAATDATTMPPNDKSDAEAMAEARQRLAAMATVWRAHVDDWRNTPGSSQSALNAQVEQLAAGAEELETLLATSTATKPLDFAREYQPLMDRMVAIQSWGAEGMTPTKNRNRIVSTHLLFGDPIKGHDPAAIDATLAVLLEARHWAIDNNCLEDEALALWPMYLCYSRTGQSEQAIETIQSLRAILERQRAQIADPQKRAGVMLPYPRLFPELCRMLCDAGRTADLLDAIEGAKGRLSADVMTRASGSAVNDAGFQVSAKQLHTALAPLNAHYLSYLVDDDVTYAVLVAKDGSLHHHAIPIGNDRLRDLVSSVNPKTWLMRADGDKNAFSRKMLPFTEQMSVLIAWLEPIFENGIIEDGDHICYCPDGVLHLVPLQYLPFKGVPLVRHVSLSRIHSGAALLALLQRPSQRPTQFVAVQVPARQEVGDQRKIDALARAPKWLDTNLAGMILEGPRVDTAALAGVKLDSRLIHFSTHGTFPVSKPDDNPFYTAGIVLAKHGVLPSTDAGDGTVADASLLSPAEVLKPVYGFHSSHVTLQACVTGLSREGIGGDAIGLDLALLLAGAQSLLITHWNIQDEASADFSVRFYENWLRREMPRAAAWRATTLDVIDSELPTQFYAEYYWAGTSLSGDFR